MTAASFAIPCFLDHRLFQNSQSRISLLQEYSYILIDGPRKFFQ
jgi:hypothetical protein